VRFQVAIVLDLFSAWSIGVDRLSPLIAAGLVRVAGATLILHAPALPAGLTRIASATDETRSLLDGIKVRRLTIAEALVARALCAFSKRPKIVDRQPHTKADPPLTVGWSAAQRRSA